MPKIIGKEVSDTGFGLMGLTMRPSPLSFDHSCTVMRTALEHGSNLWNGGEFYGSQDRNSLHLLNDYFTKFPGDSEKVVLSIKGGMKPGQMIPDGSEENVSRSIDECLRLLDGKKFLDIFECARVDPNVPIETTIEAIAKYVKSGKIGGISLSECSAQTIRRANKVHRISAVEVEFSLWATEISTNGVAQTCAELDIPIIAYSPLGRGFLTGQIKSFDDIPDNDFRKSLPRFQPDVFQKNMELVQHIQRFAAKKKCTAGQISLAWVRAHSEKNGMPVIIPIPGASSVERIKENLTNVELSQKDIEEIDTAVSSFTVIGDRYGGPAAQFMNG